MQILNKVLVFFMILSLSCIDPLNVVIDEEVKLLIVEGSITTNPGPYVVKISRTAKFGSITDGYIRPVSNAKVRIRDSSGKVVILTEDILNYSRGIYLTPPDFKPIVGMSYSLLIRDNSEEFTSFPEEVIKAPQIIKMDAEFKKIQVSEDTFKLGMNILATFDDDPSRQDFYLWKNTGLYNYEASPEKKMCRIPPGNPFPCPEDCCEICWTEEIGGDKTLRLFSDQNVNGNRVTNVAAFIEDDGVRYFEKYMVRVEHHSISKEAFQFFKLLQEQMSINGNVFDSPPAQIGGNMTNLTNPDQGVIGYFRVSDVSVDSLFLLRSDLSEFEIMRQINDDCRKFRNGSVIEPSFW